MSIQKRKLSYYGIDFLSGEDHCFDSHIFCEFLSYLDSLSASKKLFNDTKTNKAVSLASIYDETKEGIHLYKIVFKSCKYNHSPDYMSSADGTERASDKKLYEGDKELTHMCMRIGGDEAYTVFEDRKNGVSIGGVITYFNRHFKSYLQSRNLNDKSILWAGAVPPDDFLTALSNSKRVSIADIFVDKAVLGSGYLNLMETDATSQENLVMTLKSKYKQSLPKHAIQSAYRKIATGGDVIKRIRLYGKDINGMNTVIDSLNQKKTDEVIVDLMPNGTVDTYSIFSKMEEILGVTE